MFIILFARSTYLEKKQLPMSADVNKPKASAVVSSSIIATPL